MQQKGSSEFAIFHVTARVFLYPVAGNIEVAERSECLEIVQLGDAVVGLVFGNR